jgi:hydrogenase nickel incorporation protein HypA/HybF
MHEYSIVQALVSRVELEARSRGASSVKRLNIRIGELSGVDPELLKVAYDTFRDGTMCHQASLELRQVPARWICRACERQLAKGELLQCPECGAPARLAEGDEIILDQIQLEVP